MNYYQKQKRDKQNSIVKRNVLIGLLIVASLAIANQYVYLVRDMSFTAPEVKATVQKLSVKDYAWEQAKKAGLDPVEMVSIIYCESKFKSDAININRNGSYDLGLVQANSIHKNISIETKLDPYKSIDWMVEKRLKDKSWKAWVCASKLGIR